MSCPFDELRSVGRSSVSRAVSSEAATSLVAPIGRATRGRCEFGFGAIHRQQWKTEVTDAGEHAVQGGLVDERPGQNRGSVVLPLDLQTAEPIGPAILEM